MQTPSINCSLTPVCVCVLHHCQRILACVHGRIYRRRPSCFREHMAASAMALARKARTHREPTPRAVRRSSARVRYSAPTHRSTLSAHPGSARCRATGAADVSSTQAFCVSRNQHSFSSAFDGPTLLPRADPTAARRVAALVVPSLSSARPAVHGGAPVAKPLRLSRSVALSTPADEESFGWILLG